MTLNDVARLDKDAAFDMLLSRAVIEDLIARYSRGADRCDGDLLRSLFWPDARHSLFDGSIDGFADFAIKTLSSMERTMHLIANCVLEFDDADHARSETYVVAWHDIKGGIGDSHLIGGGRYLDRFERRSGEWRFSERTYVGDWHQIQQSTMGLNSHLAAQIPKQGGRFPEDPAFGFLAAANG
jgi:hypothetical protein